jgi:hypothetical protein
MLSISDSPNLLYQGIALVIKRFIAILYKNTLKPAAELAAEAAGPDLDPGFLKKKLKKKGK